MRRLGGLGPEMCIAAGLSIGGFTIVVETSKNDSVLGARLSRLDSTPPSYRVLLSDM